MNKNEILKFLEENRYADFFEVLDNLGANKLSYYNDLKNKFISDNIDHRFNDQCKVFVSTFLKKDNNHLMVDLPNIEYDRNQFREIDKILSEEYLYEILTHMQHSKISDKYYSLLYKFIDFGSYIKNQFLNKRINDTFISLHSLLKKYSSFLSLIFYTEDKLEHFDYTRDTKVFNIAGYDAEASREKEDEEQKKLHQFTDDIEEAYRIFRITVKSELHV
jgi:hypothetical protein